MSDAMTATTGLASSTSGVKKLLSLCVDLLQEMLEEEEEVVAPTTR
jgi:hypothetical protein